MFRLRSSRQLLLHRLKAPTVGALLSYIHVTIGNCSRIAWRHLLLAPKGAYFGRFTSWTPDRCLTAMDGGNAIGL